MTVLYFVRHAEPDYGNHNDAKRELTEKGMADRVLVTEYLEDKAVDVVLSSPYQRAVDTVKHFADKHGFSIQTVPDFRERKVDSVWIEDFDSFCWNQWADFQYKYQDGETLGEVEDRNIRALEQVLKEYPDKTVVIGSHGTALSTIIHYYDSSFGYEQFQEIRNKMPWIVKFTFEGNQLQEMEMVDLFQEGK